VTYWSSIDEVRRRQWTNCRYTHTLRAAVEDVRKDLPHLAIYDVRSLVLQHGDWKSKRGFMPDFAIWGARLRAEVSTRSLLILRYPKSLRIVDETGWYRSRRGIRHSSDQHWPPAWNRATFAARIDVQYVDYHALRSILSGMYGNSCVECHESAARNGRKCLGCQAKAEQAVYWQSDKPWSRDLPKALKELKRAIKEAS
jgi:hypothetical protein